MRCRRRSAGVAQRRRAAPSLRRYEPQLLHDREAVHQVPGFDDTAIRIETVHVPECRLNLPAGGRYPQHWSGMRRRRRASSGNPIILRNGMVDDDDEIGQLSCIEDSMRSMC